MKELSFNDLEAISGGWFIDEYGDKWFDGSTNYSKWVGGAIIAIVWDGIKAAGSWASANVSAATDDSISDRCDSLGSCY
jgi:bacteriocin-like protein